MTRPISLLAVPPKRLAYATLVAAGAAVLAACGHSAPTRFFTLDPVAPQAPPAASYAGPPIKLMAVNVPPALDREELVTEEAGGEVKVHDFEHWEAPLGQTARQTLIQDLAGRLPAGAVLGPSAPVGSGVASLTVDIVSFHAGAGGAVMQVGWSMILPGAPEAPGPLVWRAPLRSLTGPAAEGGSGTAQALSGLLGQLADQIASEAPEQAARLQAEQLQAVAQARAVRAETAARVTTTRQLHTSQRRTETPRP